MGLPPVLRFSTPVPVRIAVVLDPRAGAQQHQGLPPKAVARESKGTGGEALSTVLGAENEGNGAGGIFVQRKIKASVLCLAC